MKQIHTKAFVRLLQGVHQPIYVLDDELTIVFLNQSCTDWLGNIAEQLVGIRCRYHTGYGTASPDNAAAGLCPPPCVLAGRGVAASVSYQCKDGKMRQRQARFHPLCTAPNDLIAVVAVVDLQDLPEDHRALDIEHLEESPGMRLHESVQRFRRESAGIFKADQIIGNTPAMQLARRQVELAAAGNASVLLVGPPGSGRQHLAKAIHYASRIDPNAASPAGGLIPLDCSVLSPDLILSTIAALVRTNPLDDKTKQTALLLNNVDEIPAELQAELVGVLSRRPDALRLLSTANISLAELCMRGQFRNDLAALLSTIQIILPPLIKRLDDLPVLAQVFLEQCNAKQTKQIGCITPEALDQLYAYSWPGNLDELFEIVSQAHQHAASHEIDVIDLPEKLHIAAQTAAYPRKPEERIVLDEFLGRVERELIRRALGRSKGNKAKAARLLGLTRPRLYRRMVQLGLEGKLKEDGC